MQKINKKIKKWPQLYKKCNNKVQSLIEGTGKRENIHKSIIPAGKWYRTSSDHICHCQIPALILIVITEREEILKCTKEPTETKRNENKKQLGCQHEGLCRRSCFLRLEESEKDFWQNRQEYGRSPVWMRSCFRRSDAWPKDFQQNRQGKGRCPMCERSWNCRVDRRLTLFPQNRQT